MVYNSTGLEMIAQGDSPTERSSLRGRSELFKRDRAEFILEVIRQRNREYAVGSSTINHSRDEEISRLKKRYGLAANDCTESEKEKKLEAINTAYSNARDVYHFLKYDFKGNLDHDIKELAERFMQKLEVESLVLSIEIYEEKFLRAQERQKESVEKVGSFVEEMWNVRAKAESERMSLIKTVNDVAKKTASSKEHYKKWLQMRKKSSEKDDYYPSREYGTSSVLQGLGGRLSSFVAF